MSLFSEAGLDQMTSQGPTQLSALCDSLSPQFPKKPPPEVLRNGNASNASNLLLFNQKRDRRTFYLLPASILWSVGCWLTWFSLHDRFSSGQNQKHAKEAQVQRALFATLHVCSFIRVTSSCLVEENLWGWCNIHSTRRQSWCKQTHLWLFWLLCRTKTTKSKELGISSWSPLNHPPTQSHTVTNSKSNQPQIYLAESWKPPRIKIPQPFQIMNSSALPSSYWRETLLMFIFNPPRGELWPLPSNLPSLSNSSSKFPVCIPAWGYSAPHTLLNVGMSNPQVF